jgi:hypothetical protein
MSMTQEQIEALVEKRREELEAQDNETLLGEERMEELREGQIQALVEAYEYDLSHNDDYKSLVEAYEQNLCESMAEEYEKELAGQTDEDLFGDSDLLATDREEEIESLVEEYRESLEENEGQQPNIGSCDPTGFLLLTCRIVGLVSYHGRGEPCRKHHEIGER